MYTHSERDLTQSPKLLLSTLRITERIKGGDDAIRALYNLLRLDAILPSEFCQSAVCSLRFTGTASDVRSAAKRRPPKQLDGDHDC